MTALSPILLVEDNELNRDMLVRRLIRAGHAVITAEDGEKALRRMREDMPSVVLMDMNLPVKDGWTACREARADKNIQHIPIIALTAHAMEGDRELCIQAGCNDYLTKPIEREKLLQILDKYLSVKAATNSK